MCIILGVLGCPCSLPSLLKSKGRAAWEAVQSNLLLTLQKLDIDSQVSASAANAGQQHQLGTMLAGCQKGSGPCTAHATVHQPGAGPTALHPDALQFDARNSMLVQRSVA